MGTLDLSVTDGTTGGSEAFVIENIGVTPETRGQKKWKIKNTGTIPGRLTLTTAKYLSRENGCNDQEAMVDKTCGNPGEGEGELGNVLQARILIDNREVVPWSGIFKTKEELARVWEGIGPVILVGGQAVDLTLDWLVPDGGYGNEIQSDSLEFNVSVNLDQVR